MDLKVIKNIKNSLIFRIKPGLQNEFIKGRYTVCINNLNLNLGTLSMGNCEWGLVKVGNWKLDIANWGL